MLSDKEKFENSLMSQNHTDEHRQLLQLKYKTYQLEQENKLLRNKLNIDKELPKLAPESQSHQTVDKNFRDQISVSQDHYKIPISIKNKVVEVTAIKSGTHTSVAMFQAVKNNEQNQNVLQQPIPINGNSLTTTTTTPTSVVKKENLVSPAFTKSAARVKPLPKGSSSETLAIDLF